MSVRPDGVLHKEMGNAEKDGYDFNLYSVEEAVQSEENVNPATLNEAVNTRFMRPALTRGRLRHHGGDGAAYFKFL